MQTNYSLKQRHQFMTKVWGRVLTMRISTFIEPFKQKMPTAIKPKTFFPLETLCVQQCMHKHAWESAAACGTFLNNACVHVRVCVGGGGVGVGGYCLGVLFRFLKKKRESWTIISKSACLPILIPSNHWNKNWTRHAKKKEKKRGNNNAAHKLSLHTPGYTHGGKHWRHTTQKNRNDNLLFALSQSILKTPLPFIWNKTKLVVQLALF